MVDRKQDNTWSWADGSDVNYTNWAAGEPNSTSEPYAMFYYKFTDGAWNDGRWGDDTTAFICEWDSNVCDGTDSVNLSNIVKNYSGTYSAGQGLTLLDFTIISIDSKNNIKAIFEFCESPENLGVPSGSFNMEGKILDTSFDGIITIQFTGTEWINQPSGYEMLDFTATIDTVNDTLKLELVFTRKK